MFSLLGIIAAFSIRGLETWFYKTADIVKKLISLGKLCISTKIYRPSFRENKPKTLVFYDWTKMTSKDDIKGFVSLKFLRLCSIPTCEHTYVKPEMNQGSEIRNIFLKYLSWRLVEEVGAPFYWGHPVFAELMATHARSCPPPLWPDKDATASQLGQFSERTADLNDGLRSKALLRECEPDHFLLLRIFDWTPRSTDIDSQSLVKNSEI